MKACSGHNKKKQKKRKEKKVRSVDGHFHLVVEQDSILMNHRGSHRAIHNVLHVPGVKRNLLLAGMIADMGCVVIFLSDSCWIMKETSPPIVIAEGIRDHSTGLYRLAKLKGGSVNMIKSSEMHLWHRRLGYINNISLHLLLR